MLQHEYISWKGRPGLVRSPLKCIQPDVDSELLRQASARPFTTQPEDGVGARQIQVAVGNGGPTHQAIARNSNGRLTLLGDADDAPAASERSCYKQISFCVECQS